MCCPVQGRKRSVSLSTHTVLAFNFGILVEGLWLVSHNIFHSVECNLELASSCGSRSVALLWFSKAAKSHTEVFLRSGGWSEWVSGYKCCNK